MNPRLKTSKKWTAFPKEYAEQIVTVFTENFEQYFEKDSKIVVEGRIYPEEILLRVGYHVSGQLKQANFEVSMQYKADKHSTVEKIHNCIDAAASMMMEYFENDGQVEFPRTWKEYPFQGQVLFLQFSTVNTDLEAEANKLLGDTSEELVDDSDEDTEDALDRADEQLVHDEESEEDEEDLLDSDEEDEDDEEEPGGPRMFSGRGKKKKEDLH